ncbi:MAG: hypothetical protein WCH79_16200 [Planctomycetia bacterium]
MKTIIDIDDADQTLDGPGGIRLVLDGSQCFPEDPGAGCPAIVELEGVDEEGDDLDVSATYCCANNEGEIEGHELSQRQKDWLESIQEEVSDWLSHHNGTAREREAAAKARATANPTPTPAPLTDAEWKARDAAIDAKVAEEERALWAYVEKHGHLPRNNEHLA